MSNIYTDNQIAKGEDLYKTFSEIYCPYLKETVAFNSMGIEHLKYHKSRKPRNIDDQRRRCYGQCASKSYS